MLCCTDDGQPSAREPAGPPKKADSCPTNVQGPGRDEDQLPRLRQPRGTELRYHSHTQARRAVSCARASGRVRQRSASSWGISRVAQSRVMPPQPQGDGHWSRTLGEAGDTGNGSRPAMPGQCQLCAPSPTHPAGGYRIQQHIIALQGDTPPTRKSPPNVPEPQPSPEHTDHAQLQLFIVGLDKGTPWTVPCSPRSHTTNLVLVREPLLVAVSAWAWYPMATFCDRPRCSL